MTDRLTVRFNQAVTFRELLKLAENLRDEDLRELEALFGGEHAPRSIASRLGEGITTSVRIWTVREGLGKPILALGGVQFDGTIWMVGSKALAPHYPEFVRRSKAIFEEVKATPVEKLHNIVFIENQRTIRWLKWLGFEMTEPWRNPLTNKQFWRFSYVRTGDTGRNRDRDDGRVDGS